MFVSFFLFLFCFFVFVFFNVHYMIMLLSLEGMLLSIFFFFCMGGVTEGISGAMFYYLLVLVCMGGFGISLLVSLTRFFGSDFWVKGQIF